MGEEAEEKIGNGWTPPEKRILLIRGANGKTPPLEAHQQLFNHPLHCYILWQAGSSKKDWAVDALPAVSRLQKIQEMVESLAVYKLTRGSHCNDISAMDNAETEWSTRGQEGETDNQTNKCQTDAACNPDWVQNYATHDLPVIHL